MPLNAFRVIQLLALILIAMFACPHPGFAAIRTVTNFGDTTPGGAPGQLRFEINAAAPGDTIVIPAGTITLTGAAGEDANASGDLDILKNLTIQGACASLTIIDGGGIDRVIDVIGSTVIISGVTIAGGAVNCAASGSNSCFRSGAGLSNSGTVTLHNTIVANSPVGGNCFGTMVSLGHNLDSGSTCGLTGPGDLSNTNPLLGPLADNGGPTGTHALLAGSLAIDAGDNTGCPLLDQRGFVRPVDWDANGSATCDIGAYELVPTIAAALAASVLPSGRSV